MHRARFPGSLPLQVPQLRSQSVERSLLAPLIGVGFQDTLSVQFDGVDEYADVGDVAPLQFERTAAFSLSVWVKTSDADGFIIGKQDTVSPWRGYALAFNASKLRVELVNTVPGANWIVVESNLTYNDELWHHVVMTYDGSSASSGVRLYVDGALVADTDLANSLSNTILTTAPFTMGGRTADWFLGAKVDEAAVYNKELSAAEVSAVYNAGSPPDLRADGPVANLVGWWRMGEDATFPTIPDASTNTNDATLTLMEASDIIGDTPTALVDPTSFTNLRYWFRGDSLVDDGSGLASQWTDKVGTTNATQAAAGSRPPISVGLDGAQRVLCTSANARYFDWMPTAAAASWTVMVLCDPQSIGGALKQFFDSQLGRLIVAHEQSSSGQVGYQYDSTSQNIAPSTTGAQVLTYQLGRVAGVGEILRGKTSLGTGSWVDQPLSGTGTLGRGAIAGRECESYLYEVLLYRTAKSPQVNTSLYDNYFKRVYPSLP